MPSTYLNRRHFLSVAASTATALALPPEPSAQAAWIELFNGRNLDGWRPSEHRSSWTVSDGALQANGPRSHLFYEGSVRQADFRNFELQVEVVSQPQCNSGIYFHTAYQETGFPDKGFEIQINNTALGEGGYLERKRTGSLYGLRNMYKQLVADGTPMRFSIAVRGKNVQVRLGGELLVDYWEPTPPVIPAGGEAHRYLDHGTFALQCHNDGSRAAFRSVRVRPLPDNLPLYTVPQPQVDETYRDIINLGRHNLPVVDYQVRLGPGLNLEQALQKSRSDGLQYGLVKNASEFANDVTARQWAEEMKPRPAFAGLCADQRGWTKRITQETARRFDYVTLDSRTLASALDGDRERIMDALLAQTIEALNSEPVDIYAFPTYLPKALRSEADQVWNERRTAALLEALVKNKVAVELNSSERLPNQQFIESAKQAGCKFAFGTGNRDVGELKRSEYGLAMTKACKLDWQNFFDPGAWWPKAAERRWSAYNRARMKQTFAALWIAAVALFADGQALPPLPQALAVPKAGPDTGAPYAPQAILQGGIVVPLYRPDAKTLNKTRLHEPEVYAMSTSVPGRINSVVNVHNPSLEFHAVDANLNTGALVILIPGGGHRFLNVGTEGADFVPFFYNYGVNTAILRNRLRSDGYNPQVDGVEDVMQAIRLARAYAREWHVDPQKIGVMGFSAGGELASFAAVVYNEQERAEEDSRFAGVSARPDFAGVIYPGPTPFAPDRKPPVLPSDVPPVFIATGGSGDKPHAEWSLQFFHALLAANVPNIEMHIYGVGRHPGDPLPNGSHMSGGLTDRNGTPFGTWQYRFVEWFRNLGFLNRP